MNVEQRLREALEAEASGVRADPDAWERVAAELGAHRRRRRLPVVVGVVAAAAAVLAAVGLWSLADTSTDDAQVVDTGPSPTTTTTTVHVPSPAVEAWPGIWPFASAEAVAAYVADPGIGLFFDAEATALEFARAYLGLPDPVSSSGFVATAGGAQGGVAVLPRPGAPPSLLTRIQVQRVGGDDGPYVVVGADTDAVRVERPMSGDAVASPVSVTGESVAFEATVQVAVRQDGQAAGEALGRSFVNGGNGPDLGPFQGEIPFDPPTEPGGAVVFTIESAADGSVQQASVVRVAFEAATTRFSVYFHRGETLVAFPREVPFTRRVLRAALESLFAGPQPEDGADASSFFSAATSDLLRDVTLTADGTAVVDLARTVNNASTSAGGALFGQQLAATVFQFPTVQRLELRLQGSCEAFAEWMQGDGCHVVSR